ncbi:MAG: hypothetical protein AVDCRST_MAG75-37, partial [uncultured Propionibacteriaceae bacterium]
VPGLSSTGHRYAPPRCAAASCRPTTVNPRSRNEQPPDSSSLRRAPWWIGVDPLPDAQHRSHQRHRPSLGDVTSSSRRVRDDTDGRLLSRGGQICLVLL